MNKWQREVLGNRIASEETILEELKKSYKQALKDIEDKVIKLKGRLDTEEGEINKDSIEYQIGHQKALQTQIKAILEQMNSQQFESISDYLTKCYEDGFIGTMYDIQHQGIPLTIPLDQKQIIKSIKNNTKLSKGLWGGLAEDNSELQVRIRAEISRGISQGFSYSKIAKHLSEQMSIAYSKTARIVRTESHRISQEATLDAQHKAKDAGADVVKQWDSTLDRRTRSTHAHLDGKIVEVDEPFKYGGHEAMHPGGFGVAALDINCRCVIVQRAKWALDEEELKTLEERAKYFGLDKAKDFEEYKKKYIESVDKIKEMENNVVDIKELTKQLEEKQKIIKEFTKNPKLVKEKTEEFHQLLKETGEIQKEIFKLQSEGTKEEQQEVKEKPVASVENRKVTQTNQELTGVKIINHKEAETTIDEIRKYPDKFTEKELDDLKGYTGSDYKYINKYLRDPANRREYNEEETQYIEKQIKSIKEALGKTSLEQNVMVFRGTDRNEINGITGLDVVGLSAEEIKEKIVGKTYVKKDFTSTSINKKRAETFTSKDQKVLFNIILPEKSQALYLQKISEFKTEQEILIQNNAKLEFLDVKEDKNGILTINCKVVGYEE